MDAEQILAAARKYEMYIHKCGVSQSTRNPDAPGHYARFGHMLWMCEQIPAFVVGGRIEKAMRWLGFLQGAFWALGHFSVDELKADNKPPNEEFDGKRV